ncbi:MAG: ABC transporter permease [Beijerinckiaceae bacterium]
MIAWYFDGAHVRHPAAARRSATCSLGNAIYSIDIMPAWLKAVSLANPLTYEVDALRALMLTGGASKFGLGHDCLVLIVISAVLVVIAARMYPRMTM